MASWPSTIQSQFREYKAAMGERKKLHKAARGEWEPARKATLGKTRLPHLPGGKVPDALSAVAGNAQLMQFANNPKVSATSWNSASSAPRPNCHSKRNQM